jgi:Zn-dependent protease
VPETPSSPAYAPPLPAPPTHYPPEYEPEPVERKPLWKRAGGLILAAGFLLFKFGAKLKGLLLLLPKLKIFTTSATMLVSIAAYALIWGWSFAVGFVLLLLIHEMGHVVQLRREGIKASAPMFIPFLGALVAMKELPKDAVAEARVGLAGPVLGTLGCLIPWAIYGLTGDELFKALAFVGFFLNLFNLLPVLPLDGGRAMAALTPWMWFVGYGLLVGITFVYPNPIMLLILLVGGMETWRRWKQRNEPEQQRFHQVRPRARLAVAVTYVGLAVLLALGMDATFVERDFDDV